MAFEYRFNVIRFYSKLNRFVLSPRKKPNHFVLKIRPGGFADYTRDIGSYCLDYMLVFFKNGSFCPLFGKSAKKGAGRVLPENISKQLITIYIVKSFIYWWKVHFLPSF